MSVATSVKLVIKLSVLEFLTYTVRKLYIVDVTSCTDRKRYVKRTSPVLHKEKQPPRLLDIMTRGPAVSR